MNKLRHYFTGAVVAVVVLTACIKRELPSSEADIVGFSLPNIELLEHDVKTNSVYFMVNDRDWNFLQNIAPIIQVSAGATIEPAAGVSVNLDTIKYIVTAENGQAQKTYTFNIAKEYNSDTVRFAFEDWSITKDGFYKMNDESWSSGNAGITMAVGILGREKIPANYPSQMTDAGKSGNAVKLVTTKGGSILGMNVAVWAGNCLLGNFNTGKILTPLYATEFGRVYKRKPLKIHGFYKYTQESAERYRYSYSNDTTTYYADHADTCDIYAVFYLADHVETLTAYDINNSPWVIARAEIADGSATQGVDFQEFTLDFVYKPNAESIDFEKHKYKLAIVFSSSAGGGTPKLDADGNPTDIVTYAGKVGSTLIVDEVEVINE
jgi:hypothetical protein